MPSFEDLYHLKLKSLSEAVTDWTETIKKLTTLAEEADKGMLAKAKSADWAGKNAGVTKPFIEKTAKEFHDAITEATSRRNILRDVHTAFKGAKSRLQSLVDEMPAHMTISPGGVVGHTRADSLSKDNKDALPSAAEIEKYQARIDKVVREATEADLAASRALRTLADKNSHDFADVQYDSLRAADAKRSTADANAALRLARKVDDLSSEELIKLDRLFDMHANDKVFATRFYGQLGPEETLRFNSLLATSISLRGDAGDNKTGADIQKHLGTTLAAATKHVGQDGYLDAKWVEGLKKAGHERIVMQSDHFLQSVAMPYGYQSLGPLLKHGNFSADFLKRINHDMLKLDREDWDWPKSSDSRWRIDLNTENHYSKSLGGDPIAGLLDANSRAPEAAQDLFKNKDDLNYLLHSPEGGQRPNVLGHALESAVYGYRYDAESPPLTAPERNSAQGRIMQNVIEAISKDASLVNKHIGDSFGHMAAAYMPEINRTIAGSGEKSIDSIFPTSGPVNRFDETDTHRFLYALARNPDAYAAITYAQNAYTGNMFEYHLSHPNAVDAEPREVVEQIAQNTGQIQGILGHSRADASLADQISADKATNEGFKNQSDWFKTFASAGISTAAAAYTPQTAAGSTLGGLASAFGSSTAGQIIDNISNGREVDGREEVIYRTGHDLGDIKDSTLTSTQWAGQSALAAHDSSIRAGSMDLIISEGIRTGWDWSDSNLNTYVNRPK
ncbi:hypothetical protein B7755_033075 [Streptomyces sp. NBS 14/10]|uniref:hypothetical protein n=1 Tax=Streptomyces sp. NBS 14/10 TaxID=1945643 RepID=UPI00117CFF70|nr:hypothetical protein [Streptomyces sp. NBS 14/10]KAK1182541.1 hypothetical protein B7755_033075 [Streptomyces sp. NBS 14/10]